MLLDGRHAQGGPFDRLIGAVDIQHGHRCQRQIHHWKWLFAFFNRKHIVDAMVESLDSMLVYQSLLEV